MMTPGPVKHPHLAGVAFVLFFLATLGRVSGWVNETGSIFLLIVVAGVVGYSLVSD